MATQWRVYGKDTVACKLTKTDIPGFFGKKVVVGPNEAALIVKDGVIEETLTETSENIAGVWDKFKEVFGRGEDIDIFIVDTSPFDVTVYLGELSKNTKLEDSTYTASGEQLSSDKGPGVQATEDIKVGGQDVVLTKQDAYTSVGNYTQERLDISNVMLLGVTLDHEVVTAECRLRVTPLMEDIRIFSSLLRGRAALATWDIAALIRDELIAKVLIPKVAQYRASELRGNSDLYQQITSEVRAQLLGTMNLWGLTLEDFIINWGLTESEIYEIARRRQERADEVIEFAHKRQLRDLERELELARTNMSNLQQLKVAESKGDQDLKDLLLASDISRDLMTEEARIDVAKVDAQVREVELDIQRQESNMRLETQRSEELMRLEVQDREYQQKQAARLAEIDADDKEMAGMVRMQIQMANAKHDREMESRRLEIDSDFRKRQMEAEQRYQEARLRSDEHQQRIDAQRDIAMQALNTGAGDSSVAKAMFDAQTEQTYADASDAKTEARSGAEAAKHNMDTFKEAEDRERKHQNDQTKLATDMMQASKQTPGQTIVTGPAVGGVVQPPSSVNIVNTPSQTPSGEGAATPGLHCPNCNGAIQAMWKACPNCGHSLADPKCKQCGGDIKLDWKACPECGNKL